MSGMATLLLVDDTPENLDILTGILKDDGYRLKVATTGQEALDIAATALPDLVLLDVMMPDMDGFEVCRRFKNDQRLRNVPVIFVSALGDVKSKVRAFTGGGVDYVTKPFQPEELRARVATHLEFRRQRRQLAESYEKLQNLERLRDGLVHMIVHDMRSPLTGIICMLGMLKAEMVDTRDGEWLAGFNAALASANMLREMISSLLDVSRMEASKMPLDLHRVDLRGVIADGIASLVALAGQRRLTFTPPERPAMVFCDPDVTRRIVVNLVANAIKFTPPAGDVRIVVSSGERGVRVTVTDTGPGIPQEYHVRIFEKFGQVPTRGEGQKHSTGLGLAFCKLAAEAQGGEIGVDSEVGKGSVFWFVLPNG